MCVVLTNSIYVEILKELIITSLLGVKYKYVLQNNYVCIVPELKVNTLGEIEVNNG